jgi:uncharacterized protein with FMN-binding domain
MAKRAPIVLAATAVGAVAVFLYKPLEPAGALASGATTGGAAPATSGSGSSASSSGSSAKAKDGTYTGSAIQTRFGTVQVRATVVGGRLTAVRAVQLPNGDPRSSMISQGAEPLLEQEVLAKQGAKVDVISGATYTSDGYLASLQSALDKAGLPAPDGSRASTDPPQEQGGFGHGFGGSG